MPLTTATLTEVAPPPTASISTMSPSRPNQHRSEYWFSRLCCCGDAVGHSQQILVSCLSILFWMCRPFWMSCRNRPRRRIVPIDLPQDNRLPTRLSYRAMATTRSSNHPGNHPGKLSSNLPNHLLSKLCPVCGRLITWRKKWERNWPSIKYCSDACRRSARSASDQSMGDALERAILQLLDRRSRDASICPSEAARLVDPDRWQSLMEPARRAARRLSIAGQIEITRQNKRIDPATLRGPIRLRRPRPRG